ncbi:serine carboxypeptidase [Aureococcus anophagefferens]|nr:serine carboxypeptidase [Aureococcus anophagefferens]
MAEDLTKPLLGTKKKAWLAARFAVLSLAGLLISIFFLVHPGGGAVDAPEALDESPAARVRRVEALLATPLSEAAAGDLRTTLPGAPAGDETVQFSGYVRISETKHMFYLLVLAAEDPAPKPLACWNTAANMLYVESPVGVGYSYTTDETGEDLKHPHFATSDLYLTSESYGGHYVPTLARYIVDHDTTGMNLVGLAVGNPYTDPLENMRGMVGAYWGRSMIPFPLYHAWDDECTGSTIDAAKCETMGLAMFEYVGGDAWIDYYGLDYGYCSDRAADAGGRRLSSAGGARHDAADGLYGYDACTGDYTDHYFNRADVKAALGVPSPSSGRRAPGPSSRGGDFMEEVWNSLLDAGLRMMIFSGDDDSVCGPIGTQSWLYKLLNVSADNDWRGWTYDDQVGDDQLGGYRVIFGHGTRKITFVTAHHAGHMVPAYQPSKGDALPPEVCARIIDAAERQGFSYAPDTIDRDDSLRPPSVQLEVFEQDEVRAGADGRPSSTTTRSGYGIAPLASGSKYSLLLFADMTDEQIDGDRATTAAFANDGAAPLALSWCGTAAEEGDCVAVATIAPGATEFQARAHRLVATDAAGAPSLGRRRGDFRALRLRRVMTRARTAS